MFTYYHFPPPFFLVSSDFSNMCRCRARWTRCFPAAPIRRAAAHCNTLQHTATHCNTLHCNASRCNTRQHTATHCNTLQHTATLKVLLPRVFQGRWDLRELKSQLSGGLCWNHSPLETLFPCPYHKYTSVTLFYCFYHNYTEMTWFVCFHQRFTSLKT